MVILVIKTQPSYIIYAIFISQIILNELSILIIYLIFIYKLTFNFKLIQQWK